MEFRLGPIAGVVVRPLPMHRDDRGWLVELFRNDEFPADLHPAMGYLSESHPGITRGPHEHRHQTDVFVFLGTSEFRIFLWDPRAASPTQGCKQEVDVAAGLATLVIIPCGIVHGYRNLGASAGWVLNFPNRLYCGENRTEAVDEIRHEDDPQSIYRIPSYP